MKWIKTSNRKPNINERYCVKVCHANVPDYTVPMVVEFFNGAWVIESEEDDINIVEWLDESAVSTKDSIEFFISRNRKICWESEYQNGEYCIGEEAVIKFFETITK